MKKNNSREAAGSVSPQTTSVLKRNNNIAPERRIITSAMRRYKALPLQLQSNETKILCLMQAIETHPKLVQNVEMFWLWLVGQTKLLKRVWDFTSTCEKYGVNPTFVAQHMVLEGQMACNLVRMNGLEAYGDRIKAFQEPLIDEENLLFQWALDEKHNQWERHE